MTYLSIHDGEAEDRRGRGRGIGGRGVSVCKKRRVPGNRDGGASLAVGALYKS